MSEFPEHDKVRAVQPQSQAIHDFVQWLADVKKIHLAEWQADWEDGNGRKSRSSSLAYANTPINNLVAEYFEIDLKKFNIEKDQLYEALTKGSNG